MLRILRQPRYVTLCLVMAIVALGCIAAGTWQIFRYQQKVHENDVLRSNAHRAAEPVVDVLPLVGAGSAPSTSDVEFRTVHATGTYRPDAQGLVRNRTVDGNPGYLVLTPFVAARGTLLVVRGFLAATSSDSIPAPAPPAGTVTVTARAHPPETLADGADELPGGQVESINPGQQAARLGGPVYDGYAELNGGQPGTRGLVAMPAPDLSNPAGGALEPQHFAYIIQWYVFALLALAAPFVMARAEAKGQRTGDTDSATQLPEVTRPPSAADPRAAKLADRYGRAR